MKGIFLLYGASLLIIGLVNGFSRSFDVLEKCGITEEKHAELHKCLTANQEKRKEAFEKMRNSAGRRDYASVHRLYVEAMKCFPEEKTPEKSCYVSNMHRRPRPDMPGKGRDDFTYGAAALYYGFKKNTYVLLRACNVDKTSSRGLFVCLASLDPRAQAIIRSAKEDQQKAFERMAVLVSSSIRCYSNVTMEQGQCLVAQNKVFQKNFTEEMYKHGKAMVEKLEKCGISQDTIDTVMACTKPKAEEMIKLSFEMYKDPKLADKVWNLAIAMKECIMKYPEIKKCLMGGAFGPPPPPPRRPGEGKLNPFHFEQVTDLILGYIKGKSMSMLKECRIDYKKMPNVFLCMKKKYDENKDVQSKDPRKRFVAMMLLMNSTAECFKDVDDIDKRCLADNKEEMVATVNEGATRMEELMKKMLQACKATPEMTSCVKGKGDTLQELAKTLLTKPATAEKLWDLGVTLKDCLKSDPETEKCVLKPVTSFPKKEGRPWHRGDNDGPRSSGDHFGKMMQKHIKE